METVGVYDAKARFSELLDRVEKGEAVMIARKGVVVARLVALDAPTEVEAVIATLSAFRRRQRHCWSIAALFVAARR